MVNELKVTITVASSLVSLAVGLYVFLKGRRQPANSIFFVISMCIALWSLGEALTTASTALEWKIFWTRFQGIGEMMLIPSYLLLALYFPRPRGIMRDGRGASAVMVALYAPWLAGLFMLYATDLIYSSYFLIDSGQGLEVTRTPVFWAFTVLGFSQIIASIAIFLRESRRSISIASRKGLLILALAPVPMLAANAVQNLQLNRFVTTPQASLIFVLMLAYGILRYGLFVDIRSVAKNLLLHAAVIAANLAAFSALCAFYLYGLGLDRGWPLYALLIATGIPFMLAYQAELDWARRVTGRYLYGREFMEGKLLQELGDSIRTVSNLEELAESVVRKVRDSMNLSACALMMAEDGGYRLVGYASYHGHLAGGFADAVSEGVHMREWGQAYSSDCPSGRFSTYWQVGERVKRGHISMDFLRLGILRVFLGSGEVKEVYWRDEVEGEAISIPLEVHGERIGMLWFGGKLDRTPFSMEELDFLAALSTQLGVSLLNARLMQELLDKGARLQALIQSTSVAREEERIRISRELHDGLAPHFLDLIFRLELLEMEAAALPSLRDSIAETKEKAREGLRDLRGVIGDLRPSSLEVLGLVKSLSNYLGRFAAENGLKVEFATRGDLEGLDSLTEITVFRVAQEALANIAHHARAGRVSLKLERGDGRLEMEVVDDGAGFNQREVQEEIQAGKCLGIRGMRERAELLQGDLAVESSPGCGTRVRLSLPLQQLELGGRR